MAISIRNPEVKRLAQTLAEKEGMNVTEAIRSALENSLREADRDSDLRRTHLASIAAACAALPDLDLRGESEILGYGADGAF